MVSEILSITCVQDGNGIEETTFWSRTQESEFNSTVAAADGRISWMVIHHMLPEIITQNDFVADIIVSL